MIKKKKILVPNCQNALHRSLGPWWRRWLGELTGVFNCQPDKKWIRDWRWLLTPVHSNHLQSANQFLVPLHTRILISIYTTITHNFTTRFFNSLIFTARHLKHVLSLLFCYSLRHPVSSDSTLHVLTSFCIVAQNWVNATQPKIRFCLILHVMGHWFREVTIHLDKISCAFVFFPWFLFPASHGIDDLIV